MAEGPEEQETPQSVERSSRDGTVDFSSYSLNQLRELESLIDSATQPLNHARLREEITRRTARNPERASDAGTPGRFSEHDGWRGWLEAKRRRSPMYGAGELELAPDSLVLHGMQRTWLGVQVPAVRAYPVSRVRNVAVDRDCLHFEIRRRWLPPRRVRFRSSGQDGAALLAENLPKSRTRGFDRRWNEVRVFHTRIEALGGNAWPVYALILLNVAIFIAMCVARGGFAPFDPPFLVRWGANFGPSTMDAQWWRLLSAQFLHGDLVHLFANMWVLYGAGRLARQLYGNPSFLGIYLGSGICGCVGSLAWDPANVSVGASGAIFGVLAALLAFMARQRSQLPRPVLQAHWLSTSLFVVLNLVTGAMQPTVDNAAHVGGMLAGFAMGWLLARPLQPELRVRWPVVRSLAALAFVSVVTVAGAWHMRSIGAEPNDIVRFSRTHDWYAQREQVNLEKWQTLAMQVSSGTISRAELARQFRSEILPFWKEAHDRLQDVAGDADEVTTLVRDFVRVRRDWAAALADAAEHDDDQRGADSIRLMQEAGRLQARLERLMLRAHMEYRPRALKHGLLMNRLRAALSLDDWACITRPSYTGRKLGPDDAVKDAPKLQYEIGCRAQRLFMDRDYRALETLMRSAADNLNDLPDGSNSLAALFNGLYSLFSVGRYEFDEMLGRTADWRRTVEDPLMAELVEVILFEQWAWSARGHGTRGEVSEVGWYLFGHRAEMAAAGLEAIAEAGRESPIWHEVSLDVALDLSRETAEIRAIFDRGKSRFPDYLPLHQGMLRVLMPRWQGSFEEVDDFIREQSGHGTEHPDLARYARLYWTYFLLEQDDPDIFTEGKASWPDMDAGFEELRQRWPESDYLLNAHAAMACLARDSERYTALRTVLEKRVSRSAWSDRHSLTGCDRTLRWNSRAD